MAALAGFMAVDELADTGPTGEERSGTSHLDQGDRSASLLFKPWMTLDLSPSSESSQRDNHHYHRRRHFVSSDKANAESLDRLVSFPQGARNLHETQAIAHDSIAEKDYKRKTIDFVCARPHGSNSLPYSALASHVNDDARLSLASEETLSAVVYPNVLNKRLFTCPYCRYLTDRKNNLKRHVITMHRKCDRTLECCGLVFNSKAALRDHVVVFHNAGYSCRYCSRNFCRKALLKRHLAVHSGRKDFSCDLCDYATSHKSNLDRHRKIHERVDKTSESLSPSNEVPRQNVSDEGGIFSNKIGVTSDTCTESSSDVDIDGDGREFTGDSLTLPFKASQVLGEEHLTYSITRNFGQLGDSQNGEYHYFPHHFGPNAVTPSAFRPLHSQVNTFLRSSRVFCHYPSCHPSLVLSSFQSNYDVGEPCSQFGLSRPNHSLLISSDEAALQGHLIPRIKDNIDGKTPGLSDYSTPPKTILSFEKSTGNNDDTKSVLDPCLDTPLSASAGAPEHSERREVLESPLIFRLVDVISSDWEKRKEMLKMRSTKKGNSWTVCDSLTSNTVKDDSDQLDVVRI